MSEILRTRCRGGYALVAALFFVVLATAVPAGAGGIADKAAPASAGVTDVYARYVRNPSALGFAPDQALFDRIFRHVRESHVDNPSEEMLYAGVVKETGALLKDAGLPSQALDALPRDDSLPARIVQIYGDRLDKHVLWYAMIRGVFAGTGDPHSAIMTPAEFKRLSEFLQDRAFGGIGVNVELDHGQLTVVEPFEGLPAMKAGVRAGDQIVKIDGKSTEGITLEEASKALRGPVGTEVIVTVRRGPTALLRDIAIQRAAIQLVSVTHRLLPNSIGYVRLRVYGKDTAYEFSQALADLERAGARALILDIRNNGGGYMQAAVEICSHFVDAGEIVTYLTFKDGAHRNQRSEPLKRTLIPVALLVNGWSASASEITAGCLKDHQAATLVGVRTYGKGSVQDPISLPDGAAYKLTIAHFFTPNGNKIDKVGIEPDIRVEMDNKLVGVLDKDVQFKRAVDFLQKKMAEGGRQSGVPVEP